MDRIVILIDRFFIRQCPANGITRFTRRSLRSLGERVFAAVIVSTTVASMGCSPGNAPPKTVTDTATDDPAASDSGTAVTKAIESFDATPTDQTLVIGRAQTSSNLDGELGTFAISGFSGTDSCRECHESQYQSYRKTSHSRSTLLAVDDAAVDRAAVDRAAVDDAAVDGAAVDGAVIDKATFIHEPSSRRYRVERDGDQMRHHETLLDERQHALVDQSVTLAFAVGSGAHAHTYLAWCDGVLRESPITWYRDREHPQGGHWAMSPGYDQAQHPSFSRTADANCVFCHVGQIQYADQATTKFEIYEMAIGCERCHGGGTAHVAFHRAAKSAESATKGRDPIFFPSDHGRDIAEAICQQCHLQGEQFIANEGENLWDFKPGQSILQSRTDYSLAFDTQNKVVGHVEQMHQSQCYTKSESLTCTTCHHPHRPVAPEDKILAYREACFSCHSNESCGLEIDQRQTTNANDCANCHMPSRDTDVLHAALHQHKIAIYPEPATDPAAVTRAVVPILTSDELASSESRRRLLLATLFLSKLRSDDPLRSTLLQGIYMGLHALRPAELRQWDAAYGMANVLAKLNQTDDLQTLLRFLAKQKLNDSQRVLVLGTLGQVEFQLGDIESARDRYQELVQLSVDAIHFHRLAICYDQLGDVSKAIDSADKAIRLQPSLVEAHEFLADKLASEQPTRSALHRQIAVRLGQLE